MEGEVLVYRLLLERCKTLDARPAKTWQNLRVSRRAGLFTCRFWNTKVGRRFPSTASTRFGASANVAFANVMIQLLVRRVAVSEHENVGTSTCQQQLSEFLIWSRCVFHFVFSACTQIDETDRKQMHICFLSVTEIIKYISSVCRSLLVQAMRHMHACAVFVGKEGTRWELIVYHCILYMCCITAI